MGNALELLLLSSVLIRLRHYSWCSCCWVEVVEVISGEADRLCWMAAAVAVVVAVVLAVGSSSSVEAGEGAEVRRVPVAEHRGSGVADGSD